jgi:hypothetical protein
VLGWPEPEYSFRPVALVSSCHGLSLEGWDAMFAMLSEEIEVQ